MAAKDKSRIRAKKQRKKQLKRLAKQRDQLLAMDTSEMSNDQLMARVGDLARIQGVMEFLFEGKLKLKSKPEAKEE